MQKQTPSPGPLDPESLPTPQPSTQLPAPVSSVPSSSSTPESTELSTPSSIEILPQSSSSKELALASNSSTPELWPGPDDDCDDMLRTDYLEQDQPLVEIPPPICRVCKAPVHWVRIQPDMRRQELKITVGCVHPDAAGVVREQTDTIWMPLSDYINATEIQQGEAF